ncbi:hypothetical protein GBA52_013715 [Prunus armeniaca]|nr:hypothetical protein GBA52_013715 [Prunus armeniaca]
MMIANYNNTNTCYGYGSQYQQILTEHEELRRKRKVNKSDQIQELLLQNRRKIHNEKMKLTTQTSPSAKTPTSSATTARPSAWQTAGSGRDCEELASAIANLALFNSLDKYSVSPFQMEAQKAGLEHAGGKIDDITVVVAQVVASSSFTTPASLGFGFERTDTRKREDYIRFRN